MAEPISGEPCLTITQMGAAACRLLAPGAHGTVLAVLSGVVYFRTASLEILWLASGSTPMHRRCLKIRGALPELKTGAPFYADEFGLRVAPGAVLSSAAALPWQPCRVNPGSVVGLAELPGRLRALAATLDLGQALGLGHFVPQILHGAGEPVSAMADPLLERAAPVAFGVFHAFRRGDAGRAALCADALVGLGTGLTPSGDDFLGGLLFGANALRTAYPGSRIPYVDLPLETYRARTHLISWTLLVDHAKGHGIEPLHVLVNGILTGASIECIRPAAVQLLRMGHSTGWDTLAGMFAGLLLADSGTGFCG